MENNANQPRILNFQIGKKDEESPSISPEKTPEITPTVAPVIVPMPEIKTSIVNNPKDAAQILFGGNSSPPVQVQRSKLMLLSPDATDDILNQAESVLLGISSKDPDTRFVAFAGDIQNKYGLLLEKSIRFANDQRLTDIRQELDGIFVALQKINFNDYMEQEGWRGWFNSPKTPEQFRQEFNQVYQVLNEKKSYFSDYLRILADFRKAFQKYCDEKQSCLNQMRAHHLAGQASLDQLNPHQQNLLNARLIALETTLATAHVGQSDVLIMQTIDRLENLLRDVLQTQVSVWLSLAAEMMANYAANLGNLPKQNLLRLAELSQNLLKYKN